MSVTTRHSDLIRISPRPNKCNVTKANHITYRGSSTEFVWGIGIKKTEQNGTTLTFIQSENI